MVPEHHPTDHSLITKKKGCTFTMGWNGIYHYNQELKLSIFNQGMFLQHVFLDVMLYGVQNIHVKYSYQMFYLGFFFLIN